MSYFSSVVAQRGIDSVYNPLILQAAQQHVVDPALIKAIIAAESAWQPSAASTSSVGLMQINVAAHGVTTQQALDPAWNIPYGTGVIAGQLQRRPSIDLALAGYNAGTSRSDSDLQNRIINNTLGVGNYVETVLEYYAWYITNDPLTVFGGGGPYVEPFPARPIPSAFGRVVRLVDNPGGGPVPAG
jgi:soluble lytic murein transglycosylase-like protein